MLCPSCHTRLEEESNTGIQLAICSTCQGLWLKREELEKLIDLVREIERGWEEERQLYEPQPHYYEDDDHYYLRGAQTQQLDRKHLLADMFDSLLERHSAQRSRQKIY